MAVPFGCRVVWTTGMGVIWMIFRENKQIKKKMKLSGKIVSTTVDNRWSCNYSPCLPSRDCFAWEEAARPGIGRDEEE